MDRNTGDIAGLLNMSRQSVSLLLSGKNTLTEEDNRKFHLHLTHTDTSGRSGTSRRRSLDQLSMSGRTGRASCPTSPRRGKDSHSGIPERVPPSKTGGDLPHAPFGTASTMPGARRFSIAIDTSRKCHQGSLSARENSRRGPRSRRHERELSDTTEAMLAALKV